jgi:hypothetical protein
MPIESILFLAAVLLAFTALAVTLAWASMRTSSRSDATKPGVTTGRHL